ncbi:uncharacterized protein LOC130718375 isoform X2 [Lotus japonicus]|uniref:uncharacterized protein LOC130718375 isoform X2 n=1 Tax=Lotus japonicus TaxID=34305 RepID=UPI002588B603|nr:uncharacterized protein LOC130718375 isoform X2 [Lotus japonicus]
MAFKDCSTSRKELQKVGVRISKSFPLSGTSLASLESLSLPLLQEVVLSADMQCEQCQKRVADIITKMNETESVVVNVLEKKVILTFRLPADTKVISQSQTPINRTQITPINNRTLPPKVAVIKRIFGSSRGHRKESTCG